MPVTINGSSGLTANNGSVFTNASGNVGIGTSTPSCILDVTGTGSGSANNWVLLRGGNTGGASFPGLSAGLAVGNNFSNGNSETNLVWGQTIGSQQYFSIAEWTGSTVTEQFRIDSSGRVTTPLQPAFHAFPNTSYDITTTNAVIPFNNTVLNTGSHYNTGTQRFTAPIAGVYSFSASFWALPGSFGNMAICRNGDNSAMGSKGRTGGVAGQYIFCTLNSTIYLNANDFVDCRAVDGTQPVHINNGFNNFTGFLVG